MAKTLLILNNELAMHATSLSRNSFVQLELRLYPLHRQSMQIRITVVGKCTSN